MDHVCIDVLCSFHVEMLHVSHLTTITIQGALQFHEPSYCLLLSISNLIRKTINISDTDFLRRAN